jgi:lon-related putative ATP-dependent protease
MKGVETLKPEQLIHRCDESIFDFKTTAELDPPAEILGQPRAVEAVRFGVGIEHKGFNIFAFGPSGTRKREILRAFFEEAASKDPTPPDIVYVNNFEQNHKPNAITLEAGTGSQFRDDMEKFITDLQDALSAAFESEDYLTHIQEVQESINERQEDALSELRQEAEQENLRLIRTPTGFAIVPVKEGEIVSPDDFQNLPADEREKLESKIASLQEELQRVLQQVPIWQRELRERIQNLNKKTTDFAIGALIDELKEKYESYAEIPEYLEALRKDVINNARDIVAAGQTEENQMQSGRQRSLLPTSQDHTGHPILRRYKVNLVVDNSESKGAPVIYEDNPTYQNLIGRVEHLAQMGALLTDFNLIKPGALLRANGGYLIIDAMKVLQHPFAWDGLKRILHSKEVRIESPGQMYSMISTVSLEPEPIEVNVRVAIIGEPMMYYLLSAMDPEFDQLFKVPADFAGEMERQNGNQNQYARLLGQIARDNNLSPLTPGAVARVIEHSARMVGDGEKLSTKMTEIADLLSEADYWASESNHDRVEREHIQQAIDARIFRTDRLRARMQEQILRETILIDSDGEAVGQVNGLSVLQLGDFMFGRPNRITARIRMGKGEVVDIEREVDLGGPLHSKGVLILSAYLGSRYAADHPLSLSASLVFEQSYGGVDGDSASSAELYALLSAISEAPVKQRYAVTGSVNQRGQVQAIGGVNEKIEGFFDICKARGLTGDQGVLIPASNKKHLMLRSDVIDAVEAGDFHIYPVNTIDEGIEILTGQTAGQPDSEGQFPEGSINARVQERLVQLAQERISFRKSLSKSTEKGQT